MPPMMTPPASATATFPKLLEGVLVAEARGTKA